MHGRAAGNPGGVREVTPMGTAKHRPPGSSGVSHLGPLDRLVPGFTWPSCAPQCPLLVGHLSSPSPPSLSLSFCAVKAWDTPSLPTHIIAGTSSEEGAALTGWGPLASGKGCLEWAGSWKQHSQGWSHMPSAGPFAVGPSSQDSSARPVSEPALPPNPQGPTMACLRTTL